MRSSETVADVAIIGGGSAGSLAAAMLGRAGISTILVDVHQTYPPDFRCEKIHPDQVELLKKTGLIDNVLSAATAIPEMWVSRFGWFVGKLLINEYGISYEVLVNAIRRQIPPGIVQFICAKVVDIATSTDKQQVVLSNGRILSVRLIVLATGLNNNVAREASITRSEISKSHSISIGFNVTTKTGFKFPALTYFAERAGPTAYVSMFPMGTKMRLNAFVYRDLHDPWLKEVRASPFSAISKVMPGLQRFLPDNIEVAGNVHVRPVDLSVACNYQQCGLVLIGDSFATSCPAAGTGLNKVLVDVERLCNHHIPTWLATPGIGVEKIQSFYDDPVKKACDQWSLHEAFYHRSLARGTTPVWRVRRLGWFFLQSLQGFKRRLRRAPAPELIGVFDEQHANR